MLLTFDIETLPTDNPEVIAELQEEGEEAKAAVKAPSNYKDEAKIAEYIAAKLAEIDAETADKIHRTGLSGMFGRIACICYAFDDGPVFEVSTVDSTEKAMLEHFYSHVFDVASVDFHGGCAPMDLTVCGHNIAGFDLPFLKQRSIVNCVRPIQQFRKAFDAKPWDACIADTMRMWSGDLKSGGSMDKLCRAFGIHGKGDFDGSMVAATWPTDPQKVIEYCKQDVERTRQIYKRLTFQPEAA